MREQPTKSPDWQGSRLYERAAGLPIAVDEGCFTAADLAKVVHFGAADMVVLKKILQIRWNSSLPADRAGRRGTTGLRAAGKRLDRLRSCLRRGNSSVQYMTLELPAELNGPELLADMLVAGLISEMVSRRCPPAPGLGVTATRTVFAISR